MDDWLTAKKKPPMQRQTRLSVKGGKVVLREPDSMAKTSWRLIRRPPTKRPRMRQQTIDEIMSKKNKQELEDEDAYFDDDFEAEILRSLDQEKQQRDDAMAKQNGPKRPNEKSKDIERERSPDVEKVAATPEVSFVADTPVSKKPLPRFNFTVQPSPTVTKLQRDSFSDIESVSFLSDGTLGAILDDFE